VRGGVTGDRVARLEAWLQGAQLHSFKSVNDVTSFLDSFVAPHGLQVPCTLRRHSIASSFFCTGVVDDLSMETTFSGMQKMLELFDGILELFEDTALRRHELETVGIGLLPIGCSLSAAAKRRLVLGFGRERCNWKQSFWDYRERLQKGESFQPAEIVEALDLRFDRLARLDAWLSAANLAAFKVSSEVRYLLCAMLASGEWVRMRPLLKFL